jgi:hypothetical protein
MCHVRRCILDTKEREFSADSTTLLTQLANMVMREVERKRAMNDALCSAAVRHTRYRAYCLSRQFQSVGVTVQDPSHSGACHGS